MPELDARLAEVTKAARGLMPLETYRRIHDTAASRGGGTFVEIGTFCGAATIALALGGQAAGRTFAVVTADLLRPGIGLEGGTNDAKAARLRETFAAFGVGEAIRFVPGTCIELIAATDPKAISLLLLDGGGRIEMDLAALWERMAPGCAVIVDDVDGVVRVHRRRSGAVVDQKHRITRLLCDRFVAAGLLIPDGESAGTGWFRKGESVTKAEAFAHLALPAYHELVKAEVSRRELSAIRASLRGLARRLPWLAAAYRRIRPAG